MPDTECSCGRSKCPHSGTSSEDKLYAYTLNGEDKTITLKEVKNMGYKVIFK